MAKVIFLHLSVIHSVHRGGSASVHAGIPPPPDQTPPPQIRHPTNQADPPGTRQTPLDHTPPLTRQNPPWTRQTPQIRHPPRPGRHPPGPGRPPNQADPPWIRHHLLGNRLQHTVCEQPVRILLECILVAKRFTEGQCRYQEKPLTSCFCTNVFVVASSYKLYFVL